MSGAAERDEETEGAAAREEADGTAHQHHDHDHDHEARTNHGEEEEEEEEEEDAAEWERRFMTGDLPEDFLEVTEPKTEEEEEEEGEEDSRSAPNGTSGRAPFPVVGHQEVDSIPGVASTSTTKSPATPTSPGEKEKKKTKSKTKKVKGAEEDRHPAQSPTMSAEERDRVLAMSLQEQLKTRKEEEDEEEEEDEDEEEEEVASATMAEFSRAATVVAPESMIGRLTVTVVEARLARNYGFSRMDPYCRVRVGHSLYETPTCANGSKEPKWNKTFNCYLLQGVHALDAEIYDECTFSTDPLIAQGSLDFPDVVLTGREVADVWFPLSGREGAEKEGMLHIILSLQAIAPGQPLRTRAHRKVAAQRGQHGFIFWLESS